MAKLLVKEKKGASWRLKDLESGKEHRAFERDFPEIDFIPGSLFICEYVDRGCLAELKIEKEILGDSSKERVEVCVDEVKVGDLIDGIPVLNLGRRYAKGGKKMAYAYFK